MSDLKRALIWLALSLLGYALLFYIAMTRFSITRDAICAFIGAGLYLLCANATNIYHALRVIKETAYA